ncbi:MAG TPA: aldo/keto reductase [Terracidiphilus sp.]|nr:aldo/keto reductase [Terracidiphilus sp.]
MKRRKFLSGSAAMAAIVTSGVTGGAQQNTPAVTESSSRLAAVRIPRVTNPGSRRGEMLYRDLGATGVQVSVIGLGGSHLGQAQVPEDEAIRIIHEALDRGINFLDNSWDYNEGRSEERVGKALTSSGYREKAFVMTKIDGRTKQAAADQINDSLRRLQVDHIDLLQHHEVLRYDDPDRIFDEGGAMEAVLAAKQAGKVRFIGFTGHKDPHVHLYMLSVAQQHGYHFDTVQMPINVMDAHFRSFAQLVVPEALRQRIGVLGMKCFGSGVIMKSDVLTSNTVTPVECLHYSLNVPVSVQINGINSKTLLDQAFAAVKSFQPMDEAQLAALLAKTERDAMNGKYELFKTTSHFDTTARHPDWLGPDADPVQKLAPQLPG